MSNASKGRKNTCFILSCLSESMSPEYGLGDKAVVYN